MRYDKTIYFVKNGENVYNYDTGDYEESEPVKIARSANVTDLGYESVKLLYGELKQGAKVVRIVGHHYDDCDYIEIDGKAYLVQLERRLRQETTFQVVEKQ